MLLLGLKTGLRVDQETFFYEENIHRRCEINVGNWYRRAGFDSQVSEPNYGGDGFSR